MARGPRPVFLERSGYRRRRIMDALRLLAPLGAVLWLIPVLWPDGAEVDAHPLPMSKALYYVFGVWLLLIAMSGLLAHLVRRAGAGVDDPAREPET